MFKKICFVSVLVLLAVPALAASRPDIAVTSLTPSLPAQAPGGRLLLDFSLENLGGTAAENFYVRFYFTTGAQPGETDAPLTDKLVLRLEPGERLASRVAVRLPADLATGPGQFVAVADDAGSVRELSEANNLAKAPFTIGQPTGLQPGAQPTAQSAPQYPASGPAAAPADSSPQNMPQPGTTTPGPAPSGDDRYYGAPAPQAPASGSGRANLVITSAFIPPEQYLPGQNVMVNFEVRNLGSDAVGPFFIAFCMLDDKGVTNPSTCADRQMVQGLAANTAKGDVGSVMLPVNLPAGQHRLAVIADYDNQIAESDETDNALSVGFTSLPRAKTEDF